MIWAIILILVVGSFIIIGVLASDKQKEIDKKRANEIEMVGKFPSNCKSIINPDKNAKLTYVSFAFLSGLIIDLQLEGNFPTISISFALFLSISFCLSDAKTPIIMKEPTTKIRMIAHIIQSPPVLFSYIIS